MNPELGVGKVSPAWASAGSLLQRSSPGVGKKAWFFQPLNPHEKMPEMVKGQNAKAGLPITSDANAYAGGGPLITQERPTAHVGVMPG